MSSHSREYDNFNEEYAHVVPALIRRFREAGARGDAIAFLEHPLHDDSAGWVAMVDLAGQYRTVSSRFNSMRGLAWSPDGASIAPQHKATIAIHVMSRGLFAFPITPPFSPVIR